MGGAALAAVGLATGTLAASLTAATLTATLTLGALLWRRASAPTSPARLLSATRPSPAVLTTTTIALTTTSIAVVAVVARRWSAQRQQAGSTAAATAARAGQGLEEMPPEEATQDSSHVVPVDLAPGAGCRVQDSSHVVPVDLAGSVVSLPAEASFDAAQVLRELRAVAPSPDGQAVVPPPADSSGATSAAGGGEGGQAAVCRPAEGVIFRCTAPSRA